MFNSQWYSKVYLLRYLHSFLSPSLTPSLADIPNTILTENATRTHTHKTWYTHTYRQVKCGCGLISSVCLRSLYRIFRVVRERETSTTRKGDFFSLRESNERTRRISILLPFIPRYISRRRSLILPVSRSGTSFSGNLNTAKTETETFGPSSSKSKKGKGKKVLLFFSLFLLSLLLSLSFSISFFFLFFSPLSRSSRLFEPIDEQHSREHRALVSHCIWWYVYEYWLRVWRYI